MLRNRIITRFVALFVVAFICLNAGGAVCVAYCQSFDISAKTDHCPLQELSEHCNKPRNKASDSNAIANTTREPDCCPFTISFIAAPVEKSSFPLQTIGALSPQEPTPSIFFVASQKRSIEHSAYRGPPMDRRVDRLKHCINRI